MAGFIMSEAAGFMDSAFGKSKEPIAAVLENSLEAFEQKSVLDKIFSMRTSKRWAEKMTALSAMGGFEPVGENGSHPKTDMAEVYSKTFEHTVFKNRFEITREMMDDSNWDLARLRAQKFAQSYARDREVFGQRLLAGGTGEYITFGTGANEKRFSTLTADGKPLFSTAHPSYFDKKKVQSNMFSNEFSVEMLDYMETAMQSFEDDKGNILGIIPDTIIIPNDAKLKREIFAAIGADKDPDTNQNGFNYQFGRWNIIIMQYWKPAAGTHPFIMLDSSFNDVDGTAIWYDRVDLEVKAYEDNDTNAAVYDGYARWGAGFNNWRGMAIGGVAGGTTLEIA